MPDQTLAFFRRNLPHWLVADKAYFVTLRLHGTLPRAVAEEMRREREQAQAGNTAGESMDALQRRHFLRIESLLDGLKCVGQGLCEPAVGSMMLGNLEWLRGRGWTIFAAVLMKTHAHLLMRNHSGRTGELIGDLDAFKSFTGARANAITGGKGRYWARDDFDHWVRTPEAFDGFVQYVVQNPVEAGLAKSWRDVTVHGQIRPCEISISNSQHSNPMSKGRERGSRIEGRRT